MNLNPFDPNGAPWNEAVLHNLGAWSIAYPKDADGKVTSVIVTPDIDMSGYAAAVAAFAKVALAAYAAEARYNKEVGGITYNGSPIATDDRSKQMILGARMAAQADATFNTKWAASDGTIVALDAPGLVALSNAVLAHVQACFLRFASVNADIDAGNITTTAQVDAAFAAITV